MAIPFAISSAREPEDPKGSRDLMSYEHLRCTFRF